MFRLPETSTLQKVNLLIAYFSNINLMLTTLTDIFVAASVICANVLKTKKCKIKQIRTKCEA